MKTKMKKCIAIAIGQVTYRSNVKIARIYICNFFEQILRPTKFSFTPNEDDHQYPKGLDHRNRNTDKNQQVNTVGGLIQ